MKSAARLTLIRKDWPSSGGSSAPYGLLKLHPIWDPLRGDLRFEKIVASLAPKETAPRDDKK
jgi:hypothetical protein